MTSRGGVDGHTTSRAGLVLLVLEGYAYLGLIAATFVAAPAFLLWGLLARRPFIAIAAILVGIPVLATTARALRALCFTFDDPKGVDVGPRFGARLHREVQELARRTGAPKVHRIVVTDEDNASALQIPRAGVFWPRNTLCLGYPLLATLPVDHTRSVIAHELGHMTRAHGRVSSWIHRTRLSWMRLLDTLERSMSVPAHVYFLFRHYVPRLERSAAVVSQQQELVADRIAADVSGAEVAGQTLMAIEILHDLFERRFWPGVFKRVAESPTLPAPFSEMGPAIWNELEDHDAVVGRLVNGGARTSESHPALHDRLRALQQQAAWPDHRGVSAADYFFGSEKNNLVGALDNRWRAAHETAWKQRHDAIQAHRRELLELARVPSPTPEQTFRRGELTEQDGDFEAALLLYASAHEHGHAGAGLAAGRILLERSDDSGIALIEAAMDADPGVVEAGCQAIVEFLESRGRRAEASRYQLRMSRQASANRMIDRERTTLSTVDRFRASADSRVDVGALQQRLANEPGVARAFLADKDLRYSTGTQTVLAVLGSGDVAALGGQLHDEGLLPEDVTVAAIGRHDRGLEAALGPSTLIYDANERGIE